MQKPAPKTGTEIVQSMLEKRQAAAAKARATRRGRDAIRDLPPVFLDWNAPRPAPKRGGSRG